MKKLGQWPFIKNIQTKGKRGRHMKGQYQTENEIRKSIYELETDGMNGELTVVDARRLEQLKKDLAIITRAKEFCKGGGILEGR